jgi:hypothetical protein
LNALHAAAVCLFLALGLGAKVDGCSPNPAPDAGSCVSGCDCTCVALAAHSCPESKPTANGAACLSVCQNADDFGLAWPKLSGSPSLSEVRYVGYTCTGGK